MSETIEKSVETNVFEWLKSLVESAPEESVLSGVDVQDSNAQEMTKNSGIYVSYAEWQSMPTEEGRKIYDAFLIIAIYSRIRGTDKSERLTSRDKAFQISEAISTALDADMTLGERFCDHQKFRSYSGNAPVKSDSYAVINLPIVLNPTGALNDFTINRPV